MACPNRSTVVMCMWCGNGTPEYLPDCRHCYLPHSDGNDYTVEDNGDVYADPGDKDPVGNVGNVFPEMEV